MLVDNLAERAQALRLCRRLLLVDPSLFPIALGRSVVALAFDGTKEKDRLVRASLAILAELCESVLRRFILNICKLTVILSD